MRCRVPHANTEWGVPFHHWLKAAWSHIRDSHLRYFDDTIDNLFETSTKRLGRNQNCTHTKLYPIIKSTLLGNQHEPKRKKRWWRHQMGLFSALMSLCAVTGEFPAQRPVTRSFDFSLICAWINGWLNDREVGDLKRHHAHYDVTVMNFQVFLRWRRNDVDNIMKYRSIFTVF